MALTLTVSVSVHTGAPVAPTVRAELDRAAEESAFLLEAAAKTAATVSMVPRTGNLIRGIGSDVERRREGVPTWHVSVTVSDLVPYAKVMEFGAGIYHLDDDYRPAPRLPWVVRARRARALHWRQDGIDRFARSVRIEGIRPHSFIRPAGHTARPLVEERYRAAVRRIAERV